MSAAKYTPGPLFVSVENKWPFRIVTKNSAGEVVFSHDMPSHSTSHRNAAEALAGKGLDPEWNAAERNAQALADEVLRAAAPELLEACEALIEWDARENDHKASFDERMALFRLAFIKARAAIEKATGEAA